MLVHLSLAPSLTTRLGWRLLLGAAGLGFGLIVLVLLAYILCMSVSFAQGNLEELLANIEIRLTSPEPIGQVCPCITVVFPSDPCALFDCNLVHV